MITPLSTFKLTLLFLGLSYASVAFSQTTEKPQGGFVELNGSVIHYNSIGNRQFFNPGSGIVLGIKMDSRISAEINYSNAWINETLMQGNKVQSGLVNYRYLAHWIGVRVCIGKEQTNYSVKGLIGISGGEPGFAIDGGIRMIKPIGKRVAIHTAVIGSFYVGRRDDGYYDPPLTTNAILSFRLGIGYHFK